MTENMKKEEVTEKPVNIGYAAFTFIGILFTILILLFIGGVLILK